MTENSLATFSQNDQPNALALAGQVANRVAANSVFADYQERKAKNTLRRQVADLALFAQYLREAGVQTGDFSQDPQAWQGITWGLVEGFLRWQLASGYAVPTVTVRLATVKSYVHLALRAGILAATEYAMIMTIKGYSFQESKRVDEKRQAAKLPTRKGAKKATAVILSPEQAAQLLSQPNTPQGRRDSLLMCLMLEHGLRVGEVALLEVSDFVMTEGELRFYRPKVDKTQIHKLTPKTLKAAQAYFENDSPPSGSLWRISASKRDGRHAKSTLTEQGISERGLTKRVYTLGQAIGVEGLSAHDCRHYWATKAVRSGTPIDRLQDAGGWSSPAMPLRYVEAAKIANDGVNLGSD